MTPIDNKAIGYRVYEAINARDLAPLDDLFDPQVIRHAAGEIGSESAKKATLHAFETFPEMRFVIDAMIAEDSRLALRVTIHGVPTAPGTPLPIIMEIFRIENGRVAEIWGAGTMPQPGT